MAEIASGGEKKYDNFEIKQLRHSVKLSGCSIFEPWVQGRPLNNLSQQSQRARSR